jgi:hypothetical protein
VMFLFLTPATTLIAQPQAVAVRHRARRWPGSTSSHSLMHVPDALT